MQPSQVMILVVVMATSSSTLPGHCGSADKHVDYYAHPKYHYDYAVHDLHTGDVKNKWETRDGDVVKGAYNLNEPDGTILKVEYTADKHNGFNAVVNRIGKAVHPEQVHHHGTAGDAVFAGHYGGVGGGHHAHATSFANGNNVAIAHHGGHHY